MPPLARGMIILAAALCLSAAGQQAAEEPAAATQPATAEMESQPATATAESQPAEGDTALAAARALVERSDRYMHHSRLRPGMIGYGLTVLEGAKPVRFEVEILSVMSRWGPHQDVILARLNGEEMRRTGVISGMSGSPVYVRDETDGKDKLIGAIAYAFQAAKEPICGIQPITQMLAVNETKVRAGAASSRAMVSGGKEAVELFQAAMDPKRTDLLAELWGCCARRFQAGNGSQLVPLATPLMVSGLGDRTLNEIGEPLKLAGLLPVKAGRAASLPADGEMTLEPGSAIAVQILAGDADISALGTVTDVEGEKLLAMGHFLLGEGDVELPMGPGYVHAVVPNLLISFKLGSATTVTGAILRDETAGVSGIIGRKVSMVPMNVSVNSPGDGRRQAFHYQIARHRLLTPLAAAMAMMDSTTGWSELPPEHTIRHRLEIDFGSLGRYRAENVSSGASSSKMLSDLLRPLLVMLDNPLGPPATVDSIDLEVTIEPADTTAVILELRLDGNVYRPGEQATGKLTVKPFRKPKRDIAVAFRLPDDLTDGEYTLTACDWAVAIEQMQADSPQKFDPRNPKELLRLVQLLAEPRGNRVYLRLPLGREGLAIRNSDLPDMPPSRQEILSEASDSDTKTFTETIVTSIPTSVVLSGEASATLQVQKEPRETLLRD